MMATCFTAQLSGFTKTEEKDLMCWVFLIRSKSITPCQHYLPTYAGENMSAWYFLVPLSFVLSDRSLGLNNQRTSNMVLCTVVVKECSLEEHDHFSCSAA